MLMKSVCTSHACNFQDMGNESQPGLQVVEKLATPLRNIIQAFCIFYLYILAFPIYDWIITMIMGDNKHNNTINMLYSLKKLSYYTLTFP